MNDTIKHIAFAHFGGGLIKPLSIGNLLDKAKEIKVKENEETIERNIEAKYNNIGEGEERELESNEPVQCKCQYSTIEWLPMSNEMSGLSLTKFCYPLNNNNNNNNFLMFQLYNYFHQLITFNLSDNLLILTIDWPLAIVLASSSSSSSSTSSSMLAIRASCITHDNDDDTLERNMESSLLIEAIITFGRQQTHKHQKQPKNRTLTNGIFAMSCDRCRHMNTLKRY
ncbi:hypothetical protein BLOT_011119 [Blomia tropicalis]|nr:hypothetical protein BLOT_011119 [Blomia tropicalis]